MSASRNSLCWVMALLCPLWLLAADTGGAVVHSKGGVWVNGAEIADSTAIFPGDILETKPGSVANLDAEGSSVLMQQESVVKFQSNSLSLEHGSVSVGTSTGMSVHVNCITVGPISNDRTQYDVSDLSGTVQVAAHKNDVNITHSIAPRKTVPDSKSPASTVVHEGQEATRDESICGAAERATGPVPELNAKWIEIGAAVGAGALVLCLLLCKGTKSTSASPSQP